jgi:uncharacterized damage-inducible protein DinB
MTIEIVHLHQAIDKAFGEVKTALDSLSDSDYTASSPVLFNASIGQHVRHIVELFVQLQQGYSSGVVNYDLRKRDVAIETDKLFANRLMDEILADIDKPDKPLQLQGCFDASANVAAIQLQTTYYRELAYNIEHSIHHMALIRIGMETLQLTLAGSNFGMASATIKHRNTCVQ